MPWFSRLARKTAPAVLALLAILSRGARAEPPLTLEQALAEAAARNARLPVSEMDVAASQQQPSGFPAGLRLRHGRRFLLGRRGTVADRRPADAL